MLKEKLCKKVEHNFNKHPFIVFMAVADHDLEKKLESLCKEFNGPFKVIDTDSQAAIDQFTYSNTVKGVFVLKREFGRGLDWKLGKDAEVLILGNDNTLTSSEAIQMVGRSSRSQGKGKGGLY